MSQYPPVQPASAGSGLSAVLASQYMPADRLSPAGNFHQQPAEALPQAQSTAFPDRPVTAQGQNLPVGPFSAGPAESQAPLQPAAHQVQGHAQPVPMQTQSQANQHFATATPQHQAYAQHPGQAGTMTQSTASPPDQTQSSSRAQGASGSTDFQQAAQQILVDIAKVVLFDQQGTVIFSTFQASPALFHLSMSGLLTPFAKTHTFD